MTNKVLIEGENKMNKEIADIFDYFVKTLKVIEKLEDGESEIKEGATEEEITEYEQKIGYTLPEDFKDWLRLTKGLSASVGITCINIYMPKKAQKHVDGFMALFFGDDCGFRSYYINLENGKGYIYDDDYGTEEFDSFEDLIDEIYFSDIEDRLDSDDYGDEWRDIYDEMFPEDK